MATAPLKAAPSRTRDPARPDFPASYPSQVLLLPLLPAPPGLLRVGGLGSPGAQTLFHSPPWGTSQPPSPSSSPALGNGVGSIQLPQLHCTWRIWGLPARAWDWGEVTPSPPN